MKNKITETGFVRKKKDGTIHHISNYIDSKYVRLRYETFTTKISDLLPATEQDFKDFVQTKQP